MSKPAATKRTKKAAKPEPKKKAPKKPAPAAPPPKPATPAPILAAEDSAPAGAITDEPSGEQVAAGRQHGIVEYVRPNGKVRRAVVVAIDGGLATLRLQDGSELTGIVRAKSAADKDAWRPEGDHPYE